MYCRRPVSTRDVATGTHVKVPCIAPHNPTLVSKRPALHIVKATSDNEPSDKDLQDKFFNNPSEQRSKQSADSSGQNIIDNINPYALGRQARRAFDTVWEQLGSITSPTKSYIFDDVLDPSLQLEASPQAADTKVLVVGATGRVGKILIRKLLLRGYKVRALIRRREGIRESAADVEGLPAAVEVFMGDVGELKDCQKAVKDVDKVIFCAGARTAFTGELVRVDEKGVGFLAQSLQDDMFRRAKAAGSKYNRSAKKEIADFGKVYHQLKWDVDFVGVQGEDGKVRRDMERANLAAAEITEGNNLIFSGALFSKGAFAEVGADINPLLPGGDHRLADTEGITMRVKSEGHTYACVLRTADGSRYSARFPTRNLRYSTVRLPWVLFRPESDGVPPLEPSQIRHISLRYELRRPAAATAAAAAGQPAVPAGARLPEQGLIRPPSQVASLQRQRQQQQQEAAQQRFERFSIEIDWIKALPAGVEPNFVLVSCSGAGRQGLDAEDVNRVVTAKRRGEDRLRSSGLGYTVIRPGPLVDEPGGYKALMFNQADRTGQSVSAADVADICLRALHEPEARNKTFDVCYEYQPDEGLQLYELVASIPSSGGNYLAQALSALQRNT